MLGKLGGMLGKHGGMLGKLGGTLGRLEGTLGKHGGTLGRLEGTLGKHKTAGFRHEKLFPKNTPKALKPIISYFYINISLFSRISIGGWPAPPK